MADFLAAITKAEQGERLTQSELEVLLGAADPASEERLRRCAYAKKLAEVGNKVYLRGLIEFSNFCRCDCLYCGIRKSNPHPRRFCLSLDEIVAAADFAWQNNYGSVVLQSGERRDDAAVEFVGQAVRAIVQHSRGELGITLSCGEVGVDAYKYWRSCGAERYLLRIESSNPKLFARIHPPEIRFDDRMKSLYELREAGFIVGSGVMIGLPGQTLADLAGDLEFFRKMDLDMVGMGPFLSQAQAPLRDPDQRPEHLEARFHLALRMISLARLHLCGVNIASTTALQTLHPDSGREQGLRYGANVIMPNVGNLEHRRDYRLYDHKFDLDENAEASRQNLQKNLAAIGEEIAAKSRGNPPHYYLRTANAAGQKA